MESHLSIDQEKLALSVPDIISCVFYMDALPDTNVTYTLFSNRGQEDIIFSCHTRITVEYLSSARLDDRYVQFLSLEGKVIMESSALIYI